MSYIGKDLALPTGNLARDVESGLLVPFRRFGSLRVTRAVPDTEKRILEFVMATEGVKRDGHDLLCGPDNWIPGGFEDLAGLWGHDMGGKGRAPMLNIGVWQEVRHERDPETGGWMIVGFLRFGTHDEATKIYRAYLPEKDGGDGICRACSLDWISHKHEAIPSGRRFIYNEPLECSLIPVGADDRAEMVRRGFPEKLLSLADESERGQIYVLDSREPLPRAGAEEGTKVENDKDPAARAAEKPDDKPSEPQVRHLGEPELLETFTLAPKAERGIAFVLQSRTGDKAEPDAVKAMAQECVRALEAREIPDLPQGWRAIPIRKDIPMVLRSVGNEGVAQAEALRRGLAEVIEAGDVPVLSPAWELLPASRAALPGVARSARSDALDVAFATLAALVTETRHPLAELYWATNSISYSDDEPEANPAYAEKSGQRYAKILVALLDKAEEAALEVLDLLTPDPAPDDTIQVPIAAAASAEPGHSRVGKKIAKARRKLVKEIKEYAEKAAERAAKILEEEPEDEEDERAQDAELSRLASIADKLEASARSMRGKRTAEPEPEEPAPEAAVPETVAEPTQRANPLSGVAAKLRLKETKPALGALALSLREKAGSLRSASS